MGRARDKFSIGDKVRMTPVSAQYGSRATQTGTVVGFMDRLSPYTIVVKKTGCKSTDTWHMDCWEKKE